MKISAAITAIVAIISSQTARAAPIKGYDVLAVARYCETFLAAPALPGMGTLLETFGDPLPCIEKRIAQGGLQLVQVDLRDATCLRRGVCENKRPLEDWAHLLVLAKRVGRLAAKYPSVRFYVSPFLEHDIQDEQTILKACAVSLAGCPDCRCINSPSTGARPKGIPIEEHGTKKRGYSVSGDGSSIFRADTIASDKNRFEHQNSATNQFYAWWPELNLRCGLEPEFVPPKRRTYKPSIEQFVHAQIIASEREEPPPFPPKVCRRVRDLSAAQGESARPRTESSCNGQKDAVRGDKPSLVIRREGATGNRLPLINGNGEQVGCYSYGGRGMQANTTRWYIGGCSGQTAMQLYNRLRGEWGFVRLTRTECLRVNVLRATGQYR